MQMKYRNMVGTV